MRSPSSAPPERRRVGSHGDHRDLTLREMAHETLQQLIIEARLAGTPGAGDADHGHVVACWCERAAHALGLAARLRLALESSDGPGDEGAVVRIERCELVAGPRGRAHPADRILDHALEAHAAPVLGRIDLLDPVALEGGDLGWGDRAAAAHDDPYVRCAALAQHVDHVAEVLVVTALIGADGDRVGVLLHGRLDDLGDAAVVAEVNHLGAVCLQQAADHVDRRIVTVEQRGGAHEAQRALRPRCRHGPRPRGSQWRTHEPLPAELTLW